ncbi:hypothetical protein [Streptomyces sp. NPDC060205]|uniref:hypothetical protein n=1 Tax=Streptomyces sp. NPDC060205 TaxID=3347072 RepID=UPI00365D69EF
MTGRNDRQNAEASARQTWVHCTHGRSARCVRGRKPIETVIVIYRSNAADFRFDHDYFESEHLPLVRKAWEQYGLVSTTVTHSRVLDRVQQAIAEGSLQPGTDADAISGLIHDFHMGLSTQARESVSADTTQHSADALMALWGQPEDTDVAESRGR